MSIDVKLKDFKIFFPSVSRPYATFSFKNAKKKRLVEPCD